MAAMSIYDKNSWQSSSSEPRELWGWILVYSIVNSRSTKFVQMMIIGWPLTFFVARSNLHFYRFVVWVGVGGELKNHFFQYIFMTNSWNLQCVTKVRWNQNFAPWGLFALTSVLYTGFKPWNLQTSSSLKPLDRFSPDFTWGLLSKGCWHFKICSNGSASLNKMAAMPIYGKNT